MACGALGGVSLWVAVFPTDVVKSRIQVQSNNGSTFLGTLISVFKNEGNLQCSDNISSVHATKTFKYFVTHGPLIRNCMIKTKSMSLFMQFFLASETDLRTTFGGPFLHLNIHV